MKNKEILDLKDLETVSDGMYEAYIYSYENEYYYLIDKEFYSEKLEVTTRTLTNAINNIKKYDGEFGIKCLEKNFRAPRHADCELPDDYTLGTNRRTLINREGMFHLLMHGKSYEAMKFKSYIYAIITKIENDGYYISLTADMDKVKKEMLVLKHKLGIIEGYSTILAYFEEHGMKPDWRKLKQICDAHNLEIKSVPDQRYGKVNSYPLESYEIYNILHKETK